MDIQYLPAYNEWVDGLLADGEEGSNVLLTHPGQGRYCTAGQGLESLANLCELGRYYYMISIQTAFLGGKEDLF